MIDWMTVVLVPYAWLSVTCQVFCRAGAVYEQADQNGIAHFLEHMFFKWSTHYPTSQELSIAVESFGGEMNAYTSHTLASYYIKSWSIYHKKSLEVLADMLINPLFDPAEVQKEQWVVIQEIAMYRDNPQRHVSHERHSRYYWDNAYGRTVLGTSENIMKFDSDMLRQFHTTYYNRQNCVVVVAWAYDHDILDTIQSCFAQMPHGIIPAVPVRSDYRPSTQYSHIDTSTEQNHLIMSTWGVKHGDPSEYARRIMIKILWGTMFSRLFQELRENQWLCYYINANYHKSDIYPWASIIKAWLKKEAFDSALTSIQHILDNLNTICEQEVIQTRGCAIWQRQIWLETSDDRADYVWSNMLLYGTVLPVQEKIDKYLWVTHKQVLDLTQRLRYENWYYFWIQ